MAPVQSMVKSNEQVLQTCTSAWPAHTGSSRAFGEGYAFINLHLVISGFLITYRGRRPVVPPVAVCRARHEELLSTASSTDSKNAVWPQSLGFWIPVCEILLYCDFSLILFLFSACSSSLGFLLDLPRGSARLSPCCAFAGSLLGCSLRVPPLLLLKGSGNGGGGSRIHSPPVVSTEAATAHSRRSPADLRCS